MTKLLQAEDVRITCQLPCTEETISEPKAEESIIGQERAIRALQFGLDIAASGFNVYVAGARGTGRITTIRRFLKNLAAQRRTPADYCYVNNFKNPYQPKMLALPSGAGFNFAHEVKNLIESARKTIPETFKGEDYSSKREEVLNAFNEKRQALLEDLNRKAKAEHFLIQVTNAGLFMIPVVDGQPLKEKDLLALSEEKRNEIRDRHQKLQGDLKHVQKEIQKLQRAAEEAVKALEREVALYVVGQLFTDLQEKYDSCPDVVQYLEAVEEDVLDNIPLFCAAPSEQSGAEGEAQGARNMPDEAFRRYDVNVIVDHSETQGAPVVEELNPTYNNLFGRIEKEAKMGTWATDFTLIRSGAFHRANGGFLILSVEELFRNLFAWEGLKRALQTQEIIIEEPSERLGAMATRSLRPDPVPVDLKVILVGPPEIYFLLHFYEPDFKELFKVKAEFTTDMDCSAANVKNYQFFAQALTEKEKLPPLDAHAVGKLVEFGCRLAGHQRKLSTRFADLADIIRESAHYVKADAGNHIGAEHIQKTIAERHYRSNLLEERIWNMIADEVLLIDTKSSAVGQVNGLSVIDLGDSAFGRPSRITATVGVGRHGLIDIEREVELGGSIHSKGILILTGYLTQRYGQNVPLSLSARLVFEQSYGRIDGDSASAAELFALLSVLAGLPIHQGIAVTGSVNQRGELQAIGGVNEKIEGLYHVAKLQSFTGEQGVIIPDSNVQNLMLKEEVVDAIKQRKFHVYACRTVDDGISTLTGTAAGHRDEQGNYPADSVNGLVQAQLKTMAEKLRAYEGDVPGSEPAGE